MVKYSDRLIKPKNQEEQFLINIAAVGHGIVPVNNWDHDPKKASTQAKRKFRKLWRKARKHLLKSCPKDITEELNHYISCVSKSSLVTSAILSEEKNKSYYTNPQKQDIL